MNVRCAELRDTEFDQRALRDVLGCFATGVAVITTMGDGGAPVGLTVNSFTSLSLDPPLVLWTIALKAPSLAAFRAHRGFAVNIMGADAKEETLNFARPSDDKFDGVAWRPGHAGFPVLDSAVAAIECRTETRFPGGDHEIILGRVLRLTKRGGRPLLFHRGRFAGIGETL